MIYNIKCKDLNNKYLELYNTLALNVITEGDKTYYKNNYYLAFINNNPIAVYINQKRIIHIVKLEKKRTQEEYILNTSKGLKYFDTVISTPKEIIDLSRNKNDFLSNNIQELII